jgi:hypothetical protein
MSLSNRDSLIYAALGFSVWLSGALEFRLFGGTLFQSGALVFRATMRWRGTDLSKAVTVAVTMAVPGLFGEAGRQLAFGWATGLGLPTQPVFAATIFFGNAVLLTYAVVVQRSASLYVPTQRHGAPDARLG